MDGEILQDTKKVLGIGPDDDSFDTDVILHINSALSNIAQIGISVPGGFSINPENNSTWEELGIGSMELGEYTTPVYTQVKTLVYLHTRLAFDPPASSYHLASLERQIEQHMWRLSAMWEAAHWTDPSPPEHVIEGGGVI